MLHRRRAHPDARAAALLALHAQAGNACVGRPERRFRTIHVAGTNGKGSTAALLAGILAQAGFRTALYTSPHLIDFRERMRVDGRMIPKEAVIRWSRRLMPEVRRRRATFFEAVTAMAFAWFAEEGADIAVVETGLGGRLDATNVLEPMLSIITTIGLTCDIVGAGLIANEVFEFFGALQ